MSRRDDRAQLTPPVGPHDHAAGPANAPLTLVEYGDYQCPHCGRAYPIVKEVQRTLGSQLRFVFRNFPLTRVHPEAEHAAEAAEAAGAQGASNGNSRWTTTISWNTPPSSDSMPTGCAVSWTPERTPHGCATTS